MSLVRFIKYLLPSDPVVVNFFRSVFRKVVSLSLVMILFFLLMYILLYPGFFRCLFVEWQDMEKIADNIYVNPEMTAEERKKLLADYAAAQARVGDFFSGLESTPVIIAGSKIEVIQQFGHGSEQTGMIHLSPLGTYIVLEPQGLNVDVISHEMCHAEFMKRIGWFNRMTEVPVWFDEGLAMLIDYRFPEAEQEWAEMTVFGTHAPPLRQIETSEGFFDRNHVYLHYLVARHEVGRWYEKKEKKGMLELIRCLKAGEGFEECFKK